jgi:hypothetical protein
MQIAGSLPGGGACMGSAGAAHRHGDGFHPAVSEVVMLRLPFPIRVVAVVAPPILIIVLMACPWGRTSAPADAVRGAASDARVAPAPLSTTSLAGAVR